MPPPTLRPPLLPFLLHRRRLSTTTISTSSSPSTTTQHPQHLLREDPVEIISDLWIRTFTRPASAPPFPNLTGFLKKLDLWVLAYQRSCAHHTGSFPSKPTIPTHDLRSLLALQNSVLSGSFLWGAASRQLLLSPADPPPASSLSKRKLQEIVDSSKPLFQDRVVQEALLLVLEPVFEPGFSSKSHAFRPGRNAHTVIRTIRSNFAGYLWFIKADITAVSDNFSPNLMMGCLEKGLKDKKVLSLIKLAVKTPVRMSPLTSGNKDEGNGRSALANKRMKRKLIRMTRRKRVLKEGEPKPDPYWLRVFYSFAPKEALKVPEYGHCGILSPLLANVCLNELDVWMEQRISEYFCPSKLDSIWRDSTDNGCHNPAWPEFVPSSGREKTRRMDYIRYGTHLLIGIRGPREDAVQMRKELIEFCESKYGIKLENSKVEIEHITRGIEFLDHIICRRVIYPTLRYTGTGGKIVSEKGVGTLLSVTASLERCIGRFRRLDLVKGDKDPEPLPCVAMFYSGQAHTNAQMNKFLETMADWYRYADNRKKIVGFCAYVIRSSLAKLYAARYRLKSRAKVYKIASRDLSRPLVESTRNDAPEYSDLLRMGLVDAIDGVQFSHMSLIPSCDYTPFPRNWIPNHERVLREYIKLQDPKFFCEIYKSVKRQDLSIPQDDMSRIVWDCKVHGVRSCEFQKNLKRVVNIRSEGESDTRIAATG